MPDPIPRLNAALDGRYRIERELGVGGMATVYLAQDLKHGREVALKVLRPELSAVVGAERFVSEIRTTANLKHPHILPLFDSGEADGFLFYVMPYVEGESLRNRLKREQQLGVDEAVRIVRSVASALDHAHRHGIIHRDVKPENILLQDGEPVVADFGIALALGASGGGRLTETGMSLGTPSYMSPEQATGEQPLDARSDVYSLACVLYEMLAGTTPFGEGSPQAILARIVTKDVEPVKRHRRLVPANVDAALRKALERSPADRFDGAEDLARALADPSFRYGEELVSTGPRPWTLALVGVAGALIALAGTWVWSPQPAATPPLPPAVWRMTGAGPNHDPIPLSWFDIGPIGTGVVYQVDGPELYYRGWEELEGRPIVGSDRTLPIIWMSHDGRSLLQSTGDPTPDTVQGADSVPTGEIHLVPLDGAEPITREIDGCCAYPSDDGYIYYNGPGDGAIHYRLPESLEGEPERVGPELQEGELYMMYFDMLPGDRWAVYEVVSPDSSWVEAYDHQTGERRFLTRGLSPQLTTTGHLLFASPDGRLMAATLDLETMRLGSPVTVIDGRVVTYEASYARFEIASDGTLAYREAPSPEFEMAWGTRSGIATPVDPGWTFDPGLDLGYWTLDWALSPDGSNLALSTLTDGDLDIVVKELPSGPETRLLGSDGFDFGPVWLGVDTLLFFSREDVLIDETVPRTSILRQPADGASLPEVLFEDQGVYWQAAPTTDPRGLVLTRGGGGPGLELAQLRLGSDIEIEPLMPGEQYSQLAASLSPDGRWLAYITNDPWEVVVRSFPDVNRRRQLVSNPGGMGPVWSRDGSEIFYVEDGTVMSARVETTPDLRIFDRRELFPFSDDFIFTGARPFADIGPDGRFLMMRGLGGSEPTFVVIQNFFERLERLVP